MTSFPIADANSKALLAALVARSKRNVVPFEIEFVRRSTPDQPPPPLARILRGGRGGDVRLKLLISMHLIAARKPYDVTRKAASWAALLALPDPAVNGARRINDAVRWLEDNKMIRTERRRGGPAEAFLLHQDGSGRAYTRPTGRYINLPVSFWQSGWIVSLSAPAIAMWLITREMQGGRTAPVWVSPGIAKERYDLSADTRTKGTRELERHRLLTIGRTIQGDEWSWDRQRNSYWLNVEALSNEPAS